MKRIKVGVAMVVVAGIQFAAWAVNVDTFNNTTGLWSDATIWTNGVPPGAGDLARLRIGANVTLDSNSGNVGAVSVGIFTASADQQANLTVTSSGTLTVLGALDVGPRSNNYGSVTLNGGTITVAKIGTGSVMIGGTQTAGRPGATGVLNINGGTFSSAGNLSVGVGVAPDSGISGTINMTGGLLEFNTLLLGSAAGTGTVNLDGGLMRIKTTAATGLTVAVADNASINITDGVLEWGLNRLANIATVVDAGVISWGGTTTEMQPYVTGLTSWTNGTGHILYAARDGADGNTFAWSVIPEPSTIGMTIIGFSIILFGRKVTRK